MTVMVTLPERRESPLEAVADGLADDELSVDQLGSRIVGMAGRLASATCRWLLLVAAFDARDGAREFCLPSTARWLGHYCSLSRRTAIEHVRVARTLAAHPRLADAMAAGRLSYSHARAITRVAELGDENLVADLVNVAEHGTVGQLEDMVRGLRTVDRNQGDAADLAERVSHRWRDDSYLGLSAKLDPEHGALVVAAVEEIARREKITHAQALTRIAEIALAAVNSSGGPAPALRGGEYAAIVVQLDAARFSADPPVPADPAVPADDSQLEGEGGSAEHTPAPTRPIARIACGPGLPDATVKRLLCSGRIRAIVTTEHPDNEAAESDSDANDGDDADRERYRWRKGVLDVGANRRLVSDKTFRALLVRDGGCCTVPGCGSTFGLEAHHVHFWMWGGKTVMANLVLLCRAHHHAIHADQLSIHALGNERFRYRRRDGSELSPHVDAGELALGPPLEREHAHVVADAATTRWDGSRLDRHFAIDVLSDGLTKTRARRIA